MKMKIEKMHCESCELLIADIFEEHGVRDLTILHETGVAEFEEGNADIEDIKMEIRKEGFEVA